MYVYKMSSKKFYTVRYVNNTTDSITLNCTLPATLEESEYYEFELTNLFVYVNTGLSICANQEDLIVLTGTLNQPFAYDGLIDSRSSILGYVSCNYSRSAISSAVTKIIQNNYTTYGKYKTIISARNRESFQLKLTEKDGIDFRTTNVGTVDYWIVEFKITPFGF